MPELRGKANLAWQLMRRSERRGPLEGMWRVTLKDGTRLELPRQSRMGWAVAFEGRYNQAAVRQVAEFIRPETVVLDVGASIGLWTVQLGKIAASRRASLWAFEPNPQNTPWIRSNLVLNDLAETVTVCEMGLGDRAESPLLAHTENGVGNGAIAVNGEDGIPIAIRRLDDIDLPAPVSFIKIDVEGYETAVLRGAAGLLERDRPVIFGEFSVAWLEARGENLRAALVELDYEVTALSPIHSRAWRPIDAIQRRPVDLASAEPLPENLLLCPRSG
jgi:FkbM family methyltransferase